MTRARAYWACQAAGWGIYAGSGVLFSALFGYLSPGAAVSNVLTSAMGVGLTHGYRAYVRGHNWLELPARRLVPRVLGASVVIGGSLVAVMLLAWLLSPTRQGTAWGPIPWRAVAAVSWFNFSATALIWSLFYFGLHLFWNHRRAEQDRWRLETAAKEAELRALRSQLNPHFLFNSLNSLRALIAEDPTRAQDAVTRLAALLRYTLQMSDAATVPLAAELQATRHYLELEAIRLEERLHFSVDATPDALPAPVPPMLVQTLVENGIVHGVATLPAGGEVAVQAEQCNGALRIRVRSSGGLRVGGNGTGMGLRNARDRLALLFGTGASLGVRETADRCVEAEVSIPLP